MLQLRPRLAAALLIISPLPAAAQPETPPPTPLPDYTAQYHDYARSLQPEGDDAWPLLVHAADLHRQIAERHAHDAFRYHDDGFVDYTLLWDPDSLDDEYKIESQLPRIHAQIVDAREAGLLDLIARLTAGPRLTQPAEDVPLLEITLPHLGWSRAIARLNAARIVIAAQQDDPAELAAAFEQNLRLARLVPRSAPLLIGGLVGISIEALALERARDLITADEIDPVLARELLDALDTAPRPLDTADLLRAEQFIRLDTINRLYTDDGAGGGLLVPDRLDLLEGDDDDAQPAFDAPAPGPGSTTFATKAQVLEREQEVHADLLAIAAAPPHERAVLYEPFESRFDDPPPFEPRGQANMLIGTLLPALDRAIGTHDQLQLVRAATRIMLAIEIHRGREGEPPAALADLAPILGEVPTDPFTGAPPIYRPDSDHPLGYRLYSAGFDRTDDGGAAHTDHPYSALKPDNPGLDFPFVPPPQD